VVGESESEMEEAEGGEAVLVLGPAGTGDRHLAYQK
jgi:hypothetical protein